MIEELAAERLGFARLRPGQLAAAGEQVTLYHAGLSARERHDAMSAFLDGSVRIIAATVAFGMGV